MTDFNKPFLMGAETEFGVSGRRDGVVIDPEDVYDLLVVQIKKLRAWVKDSSGYRGLFLENGARLYLDYGSHPEHATAECFTPRQVALYDKAGEHLLTLALRAAEAEDPALQLRLLKNNVDPIHAAGVTFGSHESYTSWSATDVVGAALIPHLVSRVLYCGAGGLSGHEESRGFELSQRARHLVTTESDDTTGNRAIFSTRTRFENDGGETWTRIHLIGKDSQRAPFGIYLTYATTGMLIEMLNRGYPVGKGLELSAPVSALHALSRDPWGKARASLADGRSLTALQLQSIYLEQCEQALQAGGMPMWADEAVAHWRDTLTALERDPRRLADRLDPYCKLVIYEHELQRAGLDWPDLQAALATLGALRLQFGDQVVRAILADSDAELIDEQKPAFYQAREMGGLSAPGATDCLHFATRLQALELNYHEAGGLYDRLRQAGRMRDVILTQADVEQATHMPPLGGRAAIRGNWIRQNRDGWIGDWQYLWQWSTGRCLDMRDPFGDTVREVTVQSAADADEADCYEVLDMLTSPPEPPQPVQPEPAVEPVASA